MIKPQLKEVKPDCKMYRDLKKVVGNRKLNAGNVKNLYISMEKHPDVQQAAPLVICKNPKTGKWEIVDGQHRYKALLMLGHHIWVLIVDYKLSKMIGVINSNGKNWSLLDYANYYSENGNKNYQKFLDLLEANPVTAGILIGISQNSTTRDCQNGGNRNFKDGKLKINKNNLHHIEDTLYKLRQIEYASCNPPLTKSTVRRKEFSEAFLHMFEKERSWYDHNEFLRKLSNSNHKFNTLANRCHMIQEILRIMEK